jgi:DNA-damage-inducible protein D
MSSEPEISEEHVTNNQAVGQTLLDRGIRLESLLPAEDVKKVERRLSSAEKTVDKNQDGLESK